MEARGVIRPLEPWLAQTDTPPAPAEEIRAALRAELHRNGPATGFRPSEHDRQLHFVHTVASLIG